MPCATVIGGAGPSRPLVLSRPHPEESRADEQLTGAAESAAAADTGGQKRRNGPSFGGRRPWEPGSEALDQMHPASGGRVPRNHGNKARGPVGEMQRELAASPAPGTAVRRACAPGERMGSAAESDRTEELERKCSVKGELSGRGPGRHRRRDGSAPWPAPTLCSADPRRRAGAAPGRTDPTFPQRAARAEGAGFDVHAIGNGAGATWEMESLPAREGTAMAWLCTPRARGRSWVGGMSIVTWAPGIMDSGCCVRHLPHRFGRASEYMPMCPDRRHTEGERWHSLHLLPVHRSALWC